MKMQLKNKQGFTLIELLVVISIISLLSSIVLATLNNAKLKAKDAAVKMEVNQLTKLMDLEYNDTGSYCNLQQYNFIEGSYTCTTAFSASTYATQARAICKSLFTNAKDISDAEVLANGFPSGTHIRLIVAVNPVPPINCSKDYSFSVHLNNGNWYCSGSGGKGEYSSPWSNSNKGCYRNP